MQLQQEFTVDLPVTQTWDLLTDVNAIAPCLPGARLTGSDGDTHQGEVKIKVGPVTAHYTGTVEFVEKNADTHHAILDASGKEARGSGTAKATIDVSLDEAGKGTKVTMVTDLGLTGRVAQFGRGIISDVSSKLLNQFVQRLETMVHEGRAESEPTSGPQEQPGSKPSAASSAASDSVEAPALDLGSVIGPELAKRLLVPAATALGAAVLTWLVARGNGRTRAASRYVYIIDASASSPFNRIAGHERT